MDRSQSGTAAVQPLPIPVRGLLPKIAVQCLLDPSGGRSVQMPGKPLTPVQLVEKSKHVGGSDFKRLEFTGREENILHRCVLKFWGRTWGMQHHFFTFLLPAAFVGHTLYTLLRSTPRS